MFDECTSGLRLRDLAISNFRGIDSLSIRRLGRVTLLGGRNGVGKTTVLEAVKAYAARGSQSTLRALLDSREDFVTERDHEHRMLAVPDYAALFHGRTAIPERPALIGPMVDGADRCLRIEVSTPADWSPKQRKEMLAHIPADVDDVRALKVAYGKEEKLLPWADAADTKSRLQTWFLMPRVKGAETRLAIDCEFLGPGLPGNSMLARFWDMVALTEEEHLALEALRLTGNGIDRIAVVGEDPYGGRRVVVKLRHFSQPVSLKSLGDGATRLFAAMLALACSRDGFLLLDEAENGIHYSVQTNFWRMVLRVATQYNVQVLATTHSSDCVAGFARAAIDTSDALGVYLRLERDEDQVRAVDYTEEELMTVAQQRIEVR